MLELGKIVLQIMSNLTLYSLFLKPMPKLQQFVPRGKQLLLLAMFLILPDAVSQLLIPGTYIQQIKFKKSWSIMTGFSIRLQSEFSGNLPPFLPQQD